MAGFKKAGVAALVATAVLGMTGTAQAAARFQSATASVANSGALSVAVQIVGLGNGQGASVSLTADAVATWGCLNKGSNSPQNRQDTSTQTGKTGNFTADKNGSIRATLTTNAPTAPSAAALNCPKSWTVALVAVTYKNIVVSVSSLGLSQNVPQISRSFFA